jgi:hypothetical protein
MAARSPLWFAVSDRLTQKLHGEPAGGAHCVLCVRAPMLGCAPTLTPSYPWEAPPNARGGYALLDPLAFWALAGQEQGLDELALTAYRHA